MKVVGEGSQYENKTWLEKEATYMEYLVDTVFFCGHWPSGPVSNPVSVNRLFVVQKFREQHSFL